MIVSKLQSLELYDVIDEYGIEPSEIRDRGQPDPDNTLYFFHLDSTYAPIHIGDTIEILKNGETFTGELVNIEYGKFHLKQNNGKIQKINPIGTIDFDARNKQKNYVVYIWLYNHRENNHIKIIEKIKK